MSNDPLQEVIRKSFASRTQRFQAVLNAIAGEARFKALREDLERGWVKSEDLAARVAALAGQEIARAEQALRKDMASSEALERAQRSLQRSIEDSLASSVFFDRVAEVVGEHLAKHEKNQPHPTPRELSGLIVETVREVFADGARLSPEEVANVAKVQAETTLQKALTSQLWSAEVARIATQEAERVAGEHAKRLQEDLGRVKRAVGSEGLRQLETPEGKEFLDKLIRGAVAQAVPSPVALEAAFKEQIRQWAASDEWHQQVGQAAQKTVEAALRNDPNLKPETIAAALKKVAADSAEALRKEIAAVAQKEADAREAAVGTQKEAMEKLRAQIQEGIQSAAKGVSLDEAKAAAASEADRVLKGAGLVDPEAARRIAREEVAGALPPASSGVVSPEAIRAALATDSVQKDLRTAMREMVAEAVRAETQALLRKIDEAVTRRAEEVAARASGVDPAKLASTVEEIGRRLLKEEVRPLKEALLSALPVEIQHALEGVVERQGADWGAQLLSSEAFFDALQKAVAEEVSRQPGVLGKEEPVPSSEGQTRVFQRRYERGTIREHFQALREKNRWKQRDKDK